MAFQPTGRPEPLRMVSTTGVAVIGTGSIGLRHLHVLRAAGLDPIAVPARLERVRELETLGFKTLANVADLREYGSIRSIIATDTSRHVADALMLLPLGDILVEKPVATSMRELATLREASATSANRVSVAYCLRHDAGLLLFRRRLPEIGELRSVRIDSQSYLPGWRTNRDYRQSYSARPDEGGVIRDLSHELDYALWLYGVPDHVTCAAGCSGSLGIEAIDYADMFWRTPSGVSVSVRLDYLTRRPRRFMTAIGKNGSISWDAIARTVTIEGRGSAVEEMAVETDKDAMYVEQARCFLAGKGAQAGAPLADAASVVALIDAARNSALTGSTVAVKGPSRA